MIGKFSYGTDVTEILPLKLNFELLLDVIEAAAAVEHAEDGEFFVVEAEIIETDWFLHDPKRAAMVTMATRVQIGSHPQRERTRGRANQAFR